MSNWQPINKPKGELPIPHQLPPEESEPEYPKRIIFSPFECLLHFADFPELHNLAQAAQREGRSGLSYPEIEEAKAQILARGEEKETRARIIDQHLAARIDQPYGYQAQTAQQSAQSSPSLPVHHQLPPQEPNPEIRNGKTLSLSSPRARLFHFSDLPKLFPTPPAPNQSEFLKSRRTERKLYAPPHRPSNRTAFDKDFIWQLEHPRIFVHSKTYREHPPLGRIKGSSLLQDPRFNYLHNSYHETERLLRSFESRTTW